MRRQLHNMLIWLVTAEVVIITAIVMLIAAMTEGSAVVHMLIAVAICSWWLALFIQVNADVFDRAIDRFFSRIRKGIRRVWKLARSQKNDRKATKRDFVIVTFPTSEYHTLGGNTNVRRVRAGANSTK